MKMGKKIRDRFDKIKNNGVDRIQPIEEEPEVNPLNEMNEEDEEELPNEEEEVVKKSKEKKIEEPKIQQVPVPVFLTQADLNKMIYETNLLVKDIYNSIKESTN